MNIKTLIAAIAVAFAAPSFAAIAPTGTGNGELFLVVQDSVAKVSYTLDLGIFMDDFIVSGQSAQGLSLNYNVAADTNWPTFVAASTPANLKWGVLAFDGAGGTASNRLLTTVLSTVSETTMRLSTNGKLALGVATTSAGSFFASVNNSGTHRPQNDYTVNGSSVNFTTDSGLGYFGKTAGTGPTLNSNMTFSNLNAVGTASSFYNVSSSGSSQGAFVLLDKFNNAQKQGSFAFNGSTLNYTLAPVPEPESFALMLAGIAALGLMMKRRSA